jgi:hypothetical protein
MSRIIRSRSSISSIFLVIYYYFLWQFDHHIAPFIWKQKGEIIADPSFLQYILPIEVWEATTFYNICMVIFILCPIIIYLTWSIPKLLDYIEKIKYRRYKL